MYYCTCHLHRCPYSTEVSPQGIRCFAHGCAARIGAREVERLAKRSAVVHLATVTGEWSRDNTVMHFLVLQRQRQVREASRALPCWFNAAAAGKMILHALHAASCCHMHCAMASNALQTACGIHWRSSTTLAAFVVRARSTAYPHFS
jgi:hypothetical protein